MKAIVHRRYGPPHDVLRLEDVDPPEVARDEVRVRVRAAAVNPADWHFVRGEPYIARLQAGLRKPRFGIPGCDIAGEVEAAGAGVTSLAPGDAVFGSTFMRGFGAFAERVAVAAELLDHMPAGLSYEEAAAMPLAAMTALQALRDHGRVEPGSRVVIVGASGGVGTFAVQIARALGAEVTGVCSTRNVELVRSLGADHVVDYTAADWTGGARRYDVVVQAAGAAPATACRRALCAGGTLLQISGDSAGRWVGPVGRMMRGRLLSPFVSQRIASFTVTPNAADLRALRQLVEAGEVRPVIERTWPLSDAAAAIEHQEEGHTRGKIVLTV
jgi:NADPH:quinone reductase-like Zn-dependent oxidoreductase